MNHILYNQGALDFNTEVSKKIIAWYSALR